MADDKGQMAERKRTLRVRAHSSLALAAEYIDEIYEIFQVLLEEVKEIEGSEAESILEDLQVLRDVFAPGGSDAAKK